MGIDPKTLKVGDVYFIDDGNVRGLRTVIEVGDNFLETEQGGQMPFLNTKYWEHSEYITRPRDESGGHPRFLALLDQLRSMHLAKSSDYGDEADIYANYREAIDLGVKPSLGVFIRMADKWKRIKKWANGGTLKNEGVVDSLLDLASYALGAVVMIEEEANGKK